MRLDLKTYLKDYNKATLTGEEEARRTLEEGVEICKLLESYGFDFLDTDTVTYGSFYYGCPPMYMPQGFMIELAVKAKEAVRSPVIAGGRMQDYDKAAEVIKKGLIDGVGIGRASLANPEYAKKLYENRTEDIRPCIGCNMGCFRRCVEADEPVSCAVNSQIARETVNGLKPFEGKKKVVVISGGLVGCEIVLDAAKAGKKITVVEAMDKISQLVEQALHTLTIR